MTKENVKKNSFAFLKKICILPNSKEENLCLPNSKGKKSDKISKSGRPGYATLH